MAKAHTLSRSTSVDLLMAQLQEVIDSSSSDDNHHFVSPLSPPSASTAQSQAANMVGWPSAYDQSDRDSSPFSSITPFSDPDNPLRSGGSSHDCFSAESGYSSIAPAHDDPRASAPVKSTPQSDLIILRSYASTGQLYVHPGIDLSPAASSSDLTRRGSQSKRNSLRVAPRTRKTRLVSFSGPLTSYGIPEDTTHILLRENLRQSPLTKALSKPSFATNLVCLDLAYCYLETLPDTIACLISLEELILTGNRLANQRLPSCIGSLHQLRMLELDHCDLLELPDSLVELTLLESLSLRHNEMTTLPGWLWRLLSLQYLATEGNPWQADWREILAPLEQAGKNAPASLLAESGSMYGSLRASRPKLEIAASPPQIPQTAQSRWSADSIAAPSVQSDTMSPSGTLRRKWLTLRKARYNVQPRAALEEALQPLQSISEVAIALSATSLANFESAQAAIHDPSRMSIGMKPALAILKTYCRDVDDLTNRDTRPVSYRKATSASASTRSSLALIDSPLEHPRLKDDSFKRRHVLCEILNTERKYLATLNELVTVYIKPASEQDIPIAVRKVWFANIEDIFALHRDHLLPALEEALVAITRPALEEGRSPVGSRILSRAALDVAAAFLRLTPLLRLYLPYATSFEEAATQLEHLTTSTSEKVLQNQAPKAVSQKKLKQFLKTRVSAPNHSQISLQAYLLLPIQRIPRYKLLMGELVSCVPDGLDPSQPNATVQRAHLEICRVAVEMNERKREAENRSKLLRWQLKLTLTKFKSPLVQPHRLLLFETTCVLSRIITRSSTPDVGAKVLRTQEEQRDLVLLLCNDILVLLQPAGQQVSLFTVIRLVTLAAEPDSISLFGAQDQFVRISDGRIFYFDFCAKTPEEVQEFIP
ncbi:hypothetical protein E5Q_04248 [Mixia osmundae IAM 14324]|uniref:DH domain-containing protein n=1 Tax=Mixia osmundae (strain CBS 9802 / IAM 14324 / JCM 22182 / KY 12970) TaxID=764103 RepID=G7E410_MIXOS|nr:hypothetical protein E5Q_04248 [Mixia osmundae IAM 14324]